MTLATEPAADAGLFAGADRLLAQCGAALADADALVGAIGAGLGAELAPTGRIDSAALEAGQFAAHGYAWYATYVEGLRQLLAWAERLEANGGLGELEALIVQAGFGSYLGQLAHGIAMSQDEIVRPADMAVDGESHLRSAAARELIARGNTIAVRRRIAALVATKGNFGADGLDETHAMMRDQFQRFADDRVAPDAQTWHRNDELIPLALIEEMAALGVFALTVPQEDGGLGLGRTAMCVVTEQLCRGYIGVGSLSTRSDIAAELVRLNGTPEQRAHYLPRFASGEILPTAVFTEPNTGSDLAHIRTRAVRDGAVFRVTGNKTWITHGARSDLMTLLARTNPDEPGYRGISMFLAEKPRGTVADPFPAADMSGTEIRVLGYRGMKEYEISFDAFEVPATALLGGVEGEGFKQLMATFETARIQTGARAVGTAQAALEAALKYAGERVQFARPIAEYDRVAGKIGWMAVETMLARQLVYFAARRKDDGVRCDIEAGMAKLLAARIAWSNADNGVQIHGGNGYAEEFTMSRLLCDARILNIFEGTAEIQANVIARGLLGRRN